jgi:hypothetical protein
MVGEFVASEIYFGEAFDSPNFGEGDLTGPLLLI